MSETDVAALWVTLNLAGVSTVILLLLGTPLAWWLARTQNRFKAVVETFVALPLVLPPTVIGFYLLIALGPKGWIGRGVETLGGRPLAFTFTGLVIGSVCYSLPFVVGPLQNAFSTIGSQPLEIAATLRARPLDRWMTVVMPLTRHAYLTAAILGFAHTVGEFGVVLMIGGNIPGETQVLSIAIYEHVESLAYRQAHWLSGTLLIGSFLMLFLVYALKHRRGTTP